MSSTGHCGGCIGINNSLIWSKNAQKSAFFKVWKSWFLTTSGAYGVMRKTPQIMFLCFKRLQSSQILYLSRFHPSPKFFSNLSETLKTHPNSLQHAIYAVPRFWWSPKSFTKNRNFFKTLQKWYLSIFKSLRVPKHDQTCSFHHWKASRTSKKSAFWSIKWISVQVRFWWAHESWGKNLTLLKQPV